MIASRFRSLGWVAGVAMAALGCYLVSLRVASERGRLDDVNAEIAAAQGDIRRLRTELQTRGRLVQLERWNREVLALTAPRAEQYLPGAMQLASLVPPAMPKAMQDGLAGEEGAVRQAGFTPAAAAKAAPKGAAEAPAPQPVLRNATYVKPADDRLDGGARAIRTVALLDADVMGEIGRAAAAERKGKKQHP